MSSLTYRKEIKGGSGMSTVTGWAVADKMKGTIK
jgi:hypothetical protein